MKTVKKSVRAIFTDKKGKKNFLFVLNIKGKIADLAP